MAWFTYMVGVSSLVPSPLPGDDYALVRCLLHVDTGRRSRLNLHLGLCS